MKSVNTSLDFRLLTEKVQKPLVKLLSIDKVDEGFHLVLRSGISKETWYVPNSYKDWIVSLGYKEPIRDAGISPLVIEPFNTFETDTYTPVELSDSENPYSNSLIYGRNPTEELVALEVKNDQIELFFHDGHSEKVPMTYWFVSNRKVNEFSKKLQGDQYYSWMNTFDNEKEYKQVLNEAKYKLKIEVESNKEYREQAMIYNGYTLFKGLKHSDISILSTDIEARGIARDTGDKQIKCGKTNELLMTPVSEVLVISSKYRKGSEEINKTFRRDHYDSDINMMEAWVEWVNEVDPTILVGHNFFGYDLDYMNYCYGEREGLKRSLRLGRDKSEIHIPLQWDFDTRKWVKKESKKRYDGDQKWGFYDYQVYGRHVVDTMFTSVDHDFKRQYPTWGVKQIIDYELAEANSKPAKKRSPLQKRLIKEQKGRTFYDASKIDENWHIPEERENICDYCVDDALDALWLFDLQTAAKFYFTQSVPMTFQSICNTASGRQINTFMMRGYIQDGWGLPKANPKEKYGGGISMGVPGVHDHVIKFDVASLYPSVIITYNVYNREKDPRALFYQMVKYFTEARLGNKQLAEDTGEIYYKDLEQSQKIFINSAYGLLGTKGLNFNDFFAADFVTATGRAILLHGVKWATGYDLKHVPKLKKNGEPEVDKKTGNIKMKWITGDKVCSGVGGSLVNVDTDAFGFTLNKYLPDEEYREYLTECNKLFPDGIRWEPDTLVKEQLQIGRILVNKAKNYVLEAYGGKDKNGTPKVTNNWKKRKIKGSGLLGTGKESLLKELMRDIIDSVMRKKKENVFSLYYNCAKATRNIDIKEWAKRVSVSESVLTQSSPASKNIYEAIKDQNLQLGNKYNLYFKEDGSLEMVENYNNDHSRQKLLDKVYSTMEVFNEVLDMDYYPNFSGAGNFKKLLEMERAV